MFDVSRFTKKLNNNFIRIYKWSNHHIFITVNSDLWPWGFKTAFAVKDSSNANNLAIIRGYQNGAVSLGAENAPGTVYRRLQMNPDGTVVYYYKPDGVAIPKAVTLVSLSDLP